MIATALLMMVVNGDPPRDGCSIEGKVELQVDGRAVPPMNRVVVYLEDVVERPPERREVPLRQIGRQFDRPIIVLARHDKLVVSNKDNEPHDVFAREFVNRFSPKADSRNAVTDQPSFPVAGHTRLQCNIHGWMRTDVLVLKGRTYDHVDNDDGRFRITGVAPGKHTLVAWEPNGGEVRREVDCGSPPLAITLQAKPEPRLVKADDRPYAGEYATDNGPRIDRFRVEKK